MDLDTYKGELISNLTDSCSKPHSEKAEESYDKHSHKPIAKVGDSVLVYMPQDKATKAY